MPKTNEKDAYFFSHDCNARNDPKILALRSVYGAEGYGVYFMLVEILREQPEYRLSVNKYIWNTLAMQMQVEASHLEQIITDCCTEFAENGSTLLVNDGEYLYSASLLRRMGKVDDISNLRREAAEAVLHEVRSEISNAYLMARSELQLARLAGRTKEQALEGMPTRTQKVIEAMGGIDAFMPPDKKYFEMERFEQTYETLLRKNPIGLPGSTAGQRQITE